ncbi:MAG: sigma-70 family RNA polymerase sigma factor [Bacteroidetes bacterium]|nr:sigma-70 family RNA polymerase sigma factor [Bacteroidota bacterium]
MHHYTESEIIRGLMDMDRGVIQYIVEEFFPSVSYYVINNRGREEDAEDIFQDAMVVILKRLKEGELNLHCSLKTYVYAICRNLWLKKVAWMHRRNLVHAGVTNEYLLEEDALNRPVKNEEMRILLYQRNFLKLSELCRKMIEFFLQGKSFTEISASLGIENPQKARKRKYRCLKRLVNLINHDPEYLRLIEDEYA